MNPVIQNQGNSVFVNTTNNGPSNPIAALDPTSWEELQTEWAFLQTELNMVQIYINEGASSYASNEIQAMIATFNEMITIAGPYTSLVNELQDGITLVKQIQTDINQGDTSDALTLIQQMNDPNNGYLATLWPYVDPPSGSQSRDTISLSNSGSTNWGEMEQEYNNVWGAANEAEYYIQNEQWPAAAHDIQMMLTNLNAMIAGAGPYTSLVNELQDGITFVNQLSGYVNSGDETDALSLIEQINDPTNGYLANLWNYFPQ